MKTTLYSLAVLAGLGFGLASCQKNALEPSAPTASGTKQARLEAESASMPQSYRLIKHGKSTLSYFPDGKLKRVANSRGLLSDYTDYVYGNGWIETTSYLDTHLWQVDRYLLDANGRCVESSHKKYTHPYTTFTTDEFTYAYAPDGYLAKKLVKGTTQAGAKYYYQNGDLESVLEYYKPLGLVDPKLMGIHKFTYKLANSGFLDDRNHLNPQIVNFSDWGFKGDVWADPYLRQEKYPDPYLRIFGKASKHLPTSWSYYGHSSGWEGYLQYENILNTEGYLSEVKTTYLNGSVTSTGFGYLVAPIGVHP